MTRLLLATNNAHKVRELRQILAGVPFTLATPVQEGIVHDVPETGATYAENASLKARTLARSSGLLTLADDSGLEVEALGGEPGIRSARYAGEGAPNAERIAKLLDRMRDVPWERRRAQFVCVIAIAEPGGREWFCEGRCAGYIALEPRGEQGFGYDPVFYLPEYGCTMAELDELVKNLVSHRGRAGRAAAELLCRLASSGR